MSSKILLIDDEEIIQVGITRYLKQHDYQVSQAYNLQEARQFINTDSFDAVLLDVKLPDGISLEFIRDVISRSEETPIIVMSGAADIPTAVEAIRLGASNFITKPLEIEGLGLSILKCLEHEQLKKHQRQEIRLKTNGAKEPFFGYSHESKQIRHFAKVAARNQSIVLLLGETGTGKGVLAKWIHENSSRCKGNYVELNCSTLKGELLRSELYGHARGAFTSAIKDREGLIEIADNGTLFLDEIGDMDLSVQAELLKTIEEKKFRRIGENKMRSSDFRLICATNKDLKTEAELGKFRSDLYYRICVFPIDLPPLRLRHEDILGFAKYFLLSHGYKNFPLSTDVNNCLTRYSWPGNVREMRNVIERALLLANGQTLAPDHFPGLDEQRLTFTTSPFQHQTIMEIQKEHIVRTYKHFSGHLLKASKALGISAEILENKLTEFGLLGNSSEKIHKKTYVKS